MATIGVEDTKLDSLRVGGEQREIGAFAIEGGA
jgi:hypothetical protein